MPEEKCLPVDDNTMTWRDKLMSPRGACKGGDTTTAGGLVFSSANHGEALAFDAKTGKELWHFKGPENLWGAPIVFEAGGNEYVAYYKETSLVVRARKSHEILVDGADWAI